MEKLTKTGKEFEETLNALLEENNLTKEEVVYKEGEVKKGLFKGTTVEVIVYKKEDIYNMAKDFLKEVINGLGIEVSFEVKKDENHTTIKMYSDNNGILIGHDGNTMKALETLVKQKIQTETGIFFVVSLDVENYKDKKNERLERLAKKVAREVLRTKMPVALENMNSYERRVVHNALSSFKDITSASEGEEPHRHIVIDIKK